MSRDVDSGAGVERAALDSAYARLQTLEQQNALLRDLIGISSRLSAMALGGADLQTLTEQFAHLVGRVVVLLDPLASVLAEARGPATTANSRAQWAQDDGPLARVLRTVAEERRPLRIPPLLDAGLAGPAVIAPLAVADQILGYVVSINPDDVSDAELDLLTVEHAATVFTLALMRERMAAGLANRFREDLLEALLSGQVSSGAQARDWARLLGYEVGRAYRVLVLAPREVTKAADSAAEPTPELGPRHYLFHSLLDALARLEPKAIGVARRDDLVVLAPEPDGLPRSLSPSKLAGELARQSGPRATTGAIAVGIGGVCQDPADLPRSLLQARQAIQIGRLLRREASVIDFEELGVYRLLFQTASADELRAYAARVLGSLLDYDRRHQADFVRTLRAFFEHNGSLQSAARDLIVHVNTVTYRMQRIEQITGLDLSRADDRLAAQLALKILDGLEP